MHIVFVSWSQTNFYFITSKGKKILKGYHSANLKKLVAQILKNNTEFYLPHPFSSLSLSVCLALSLSHAFVWARYNIRATFGIVDASEASSNFLGIKQLNYNRFSEARLFLYSASRSEIEKKMKRNCSSAHRVGRRESTDTHRRASSFPLERPRRRSERDRFELQPLRAF